MPLLPDQLYHCYNQGNNSAQIFTSEKEYLHFLKLCHRFVKPNANISAWCLMPNHFHFLLHTTIASVEVMRLGSLHTQALPNAFRLLLSTYAQHFNDWHGRTGSLFRQKTKFKSVESGDRFYDLALIDYIHQNPVRAGLATIDTGWPYSSAQDFAKLRSGVLADVALAKQLVR